MSAAPRGRRAMRAAACMSVAGVALALALGGPATGASAGGDRTASAAPTAGTAAVKTVRVADNFFAPRRLTVKAGTTIRWRWSNANADTHDVALRKRPKGVRRFNSPPAATHFTYRRKLRKPGTYRMICTFHAGMAMRVTVRRR